MSESPEEEDRLHKLPPWSDEDGPDDSRARYHHLDAVCKHRIVSRLQHLLVSDWDINECFFMSPWAEECQHALNMAVWCNWQTGVSMLLDAGATTHRVSDSFCKAAPLIPDAVINFCNLSGELSYNNSNNNIVDNTDSEADISSKNCQTELESSLAIVQQLIRAGCDVNRAGDDGLPVLQIATRCQDVRALRLLLAAGAKVNMQNDRASAKGRSPLTKAVDTNNKAAVKLLLQYGANVNVRCQAASSALLGRRVTYQGLVSRSIDLQHFDLTEILVRAGSNVNMQDRVKLESLVRFTAYDAFNDGWETEEEEEILGLSHSGNDVIVHHRDYNDSDHQSCIDHSNTSSPRRQLLGSKDRHLAELVKLSQLVNKPLSLKGLCRRFLRLSLGFHNPERVKTLAVPRVLKEFLLCRDM